MFKALKSLFSVPVEQGTQISYQKAVAALMMEVMLADHQVDEKEEQQVKRLLREVSELGDDIDTLFAEARSGVEQANDLYQFTKVINETATLEQKMLLLKGLWRVALADGDLDAHEDHRIRRISELLFMPHSEFIQAKLFVQKEMRAES
ncbi:TerB family tellurite resistance protein [Marinomonas sp. M1K-6]|uniref:TerB family tellurite resistance protein n=1 Tax=Marinomonas profundi TaxID=2726122 RepID=A0A847QZD6_9GAMM|nr:TerB family tellurite resistance protein [Marinomonas profundi]NLQ16351.1 TerB family tellurite resistance protein [Marinomonas profundi]UDV03074.1 TerB family tellurite resistance protein [Marinomonas profundi]